MNGDVSALGKWVQTVYYLSMCFCCPSSLVFLFSRWKLGPGERNILNAESELLVLCAYRLHVFKKN